MSRRPAFFRSLRWRVQAWHGVLLALVLGVLGTAAHRFEARLRADRADDELYRLALAVNEAAKPRPPRSRQPRADENEAGGSVAEGRPARAARRSPTPDEVLTRQDRERGVYYGAWRRNAEPRFLASDNVPEDLPPPGERGDGFRTRGELREAFVEGNPGDIAVVGRPLTADRAELHRLAGLIAGVSASVWLAAMLTGWWLVGRALRPVTDISDAAERIAGGDLSRRIDTRDTDSELGRLATVLNASFARLEAAFAQQGSFTADAAHELRTPVTVMLIQVQGALAAGGLSEEHREIFAACERAGQRMRRLIESLLQLARLDAGEEARRREDLDLAALAREAVAQLRPLAEGRGIVFRLEAGSAPVRGDADRLAQVLTNLLTNAIHHNREGGEVRVETRAVRGGAELVVADTGPGIAPEHLPHIFERFYRADQARTHRGRTGLGLAIVKAIVEAHGGEITAASEPGRGATFTVRLPAG